jgi:diadenosine tetraphosphate (Ap4A) HIT family hydrolase
MASVDSAARACGICANIERLRAGGSADFIAELPRSWMALGDAQFYRGYCVLFAKRHVKELHLMPRGEAHELLDEMLAASKAISAVVAPHKLNHECLGNQEPHVHWHIFPRAAADAMLLQPVWMRAERDRQVTLEDSDRRGLIAALRQELLRALPTARWS